MKTFQSLLAEQLELNGLISESFHLNDPQAYFFKKYLLGDLFPGAPAKTEKALFFEFCRNNRISRVVHETGISRTVSAFDFNKNLQTDSIFTTTLQIEKQNTVPKEVTALRTESTVINNELKQPYHSLAWFLYHPEVWPDNNTRSELGERFTVVYENADQRINLLSEPKVNRKSPKKQVRKHCFAKNKTGNEFHYRYQYGKRIGNTIMAVRVDSSDLVCFRTFTRYELNNRAQVENIQVLRTDKKETPFAENLEFSVPVSDSIAVSWIAGRFASGSVFMRNTDNGNEGIEKKYFIQVTPGNDQVIIKEDFSTGATAFRSRTCVFDKTNRIISFQSDEINRLFLYDHEGRITAVKDSISNSDNNSTLRFTYKEKKTETVKRSYPGVIRPEKNRIIPDVNDTLPPGLFDNEGNLNEWVVGYDQAGRVVKLTHQQLTRSSSQTDLTGKPRNYRYRERKYTFQYDQKGLPVLPGWKIFYSE